MSQEPNQAPNQSRFFLAVLLSVGVLLSWSFLFPTAPEDPNANTAATQTVQQPAQTTQQAVQPTEQTVANTASDNSPNRTITVRTPLYTVQLDSRGAAVKSWVLLKNKVADRTKELTSVAGTKDNPVPLELVPAEAIKRDELPLRVTTGDAALDTALNAGTYTVSGVEGDAPEAAIEVAEGEAKQIDFVLRDSANNVEAVKTFVFRGGEYVSDVSLKLVRNGNAIPNAKLFVGPSIGDQGVRKYDYYQIEPEAVANFTNNSTERHTAASFVDTNNGRFALNGTIDYAGVADTYFAMTAVPTTQISGLEYQTEKYEYEIDGAKQTRHLTTALVPVPTDGTPTKLYVGSKDHYLLGETAASLSKTLGREVNLDSLINYGWMGFLTRPIGIPILWTINQFNVITKNYGVAIVLFTILFYSLLFPVKWFQSRSFKKAAKNAPRMKELQERYKEYQEKKIPLEDPRMRELQMEQLKLTKDAVPIGGCLPLLLQLPLLYALLVAITISLDFRQASFLWLPDLSAGDPFHVLEFLFAGSMFVMMQVTPTAAVVTPEQQMQQKMMTYFMPVMMLWMMWGSPAGLLVYWLVGNVIGFGQQMFINRIINRNSDDPPSATVDPVDRPMTKKERMRASLSPSS